MIQSVAIFFISREDSDVMESSVSGGMVVSLTPEMVSAQFSSAELTAISEEKHV